MIKHLLCQSSSAVQFPSYSTSYSIDLFPPCASGPFSYRTLFLLASGISVVPALLQGIDIFFSPFFFQSVLLTELSVQSVDPKVGEGNIYFGCAQSKSQLWQSDPRAQLGLVLLWRDH